MNTNERFNDTATIRITVPPSHDTMGRTPPFPEPEPRRDPNTCPDCGRLCSNLRGVGMHQKRYCPKRVSP